MSADGDSDSSTHTRREFIGYAGPIVGFGAIGTGGTTGNGLKNLLSNPQTVTPNEHYSGSDSFHDFPDDPFIVPVGNRWFSHRSDLIGSWIPEEDRTFNGYQATTLNQKIRTVAGLHLDALDSQGLDNFENGQLLSPEPVTGVLEFGKQTGTPAASGWNFTVNIDDPLRRYGPIMDANGWQHPDGTPLDSPRGLLLRDLDGRIRHIFETRAVASAFAPGILDLLVYATEQRIRQGFTGFWADGGVGVFRNGGLDFSVWATAGFQDHLSTLPEERLTELGIDNPHSFDIRTYLEEENLMPDADRDPRSDPVFREYLLHHHLGIKAFFEGYRNAIEQSFPERMAQGQIKLWTNQYMANFEAPQAANVYTSDSFDIIHTEIAPTVRPGVDFVYKLLRALGRFSKPVMAKGTLDQYDGPRKDAFDSRSPYRMLQRFLMAEAYANGTILKPALTAAHIDESLTNWIHADGTVPSELRSFIDFVWSHRRFLDPMKIESDARCAVVWSLPTRIWRYEPQWGIGGGGDTPLIDSFVGTTRLLREAQLPYDILVFGHPRLWDDDEQLERLMGYDAVVLPGVECLSESQLVTLEEYLASGGSIVTSGQPPGRNEMYVADGDVAAAFEGDGVTVLAEDPGYIRATEGKSEGTLIDAIKDIGIDPATPDSDAALAVNRLTKPDEDRLIVHLLNYDYAPETDEFSAKADIVLRLEAPEHEVTIARYYSPQRITDLDFTNQSNQIELIVPELVEWGFVVLATGEEDLVEFNSESSARELIEEGKQSVADAHESDRDWGPDFALATTKLDAARTARDYEAYAQAEMAAREALEAIANTYRRPVIGIDLSHKQDAWDPPSWTEIEADIPFWWLEEHFNEYRFKMVDSWEAAELNSIDVLLVPPALDPPVSSFGFETDELDQVEEFVSSGGSVVIIGDGRAASDFDRLTNRFGFRFSGPPIQFPEGVWGMAPTSDSHPLTHDIDAISLGNATPIERWPESADILAAISEESQAWLSTEPPQHERSDDEASAAGAPVFAHSRHGAGHVMVLGSPSFAFTPMHADPAMRLMYNTFTFLGRESVQQRMESATTRSSPTSTGSPSTALTTVTDGQPGFSFKASVIGVIAVVANYLRHARNN